ncbi:MAG TPA: 4-hydroxyphenylacetate 3-hydroxylase N-terminal domain-containing protein [Bacillota bacterium]
MPLRTAEEYQASLRDGRVVYYRGQRVDDVTTHPVIGKAVRHAAIDYELAEDPETRELATVIDPESGERISRYYAIPRTADDLLARSRLIETSTARGGTLVVLIKEIGTDALFALHILSAEMDAKFGTSYRPRVEAFYRYCRDHDLAVAVAQTDVKGDRSGGPREQAHPDYYLRIVERRPDGIVVRGAKAHTSVTPNANEIIVLPTRAMRPGDEDYAVAFAVPANAPGLKMIASPYGGFPKNDHEHPVSARHKMMETLTIFDDVFVPNERVFLCGETEFAGPLALGFVAFHRFTAVSYKLPLLDAFVGAAALMAQYNGIERAGHVREKLIRLITYAETVRGLIHRAAERPQLRAGIAVPDPLLTNMAKYTFAHGFHEALRDVQDIAGGLLVTGPAAEDWDNPETAPYLERYLGTGRVDAQNRMRLMNLISDLTASDFGGYQAVLAVHAEGSLEAEKLQIYRAYDFGPAIAYAKRLAGIED